MIEAVILIEPIRLGEIIYTHETVGMRDYWFRRYFYMDLMCMLYIPCFRLYTAVGRD